LWFVPPVFRAGEGVRDFDMEVRELRGRFTYEELPGLLEH